MAKVTWEVTGWEVTHAVIKSKIPTKNCTTFVIWWNSSYQLINGHRNSTLVRRIADYFFFIQFIVILRRLIYRGLGQEAKNITIAN